MNESQSQSDLRRLEQLASEKCNGSLSPAGYAELLSLLAKSEELRSTYWQMNAMHADLEWDLVGKDNSYREVLCQLPQLLIVGSPAIGACRGSSMKSFRRRWWSPTIAAGIASIFVSGWILWYLIESQQAPPIAEMARKSSDTAPTAAKLISLTPNSRWNFGSSDDRNPTDFNCGDTVWVEEGMVEMQLEGGVNGQLRSPVILQLLSQDRVRLLSGKIKVNAPAQTDGFTIETPSAEVVDLGTVFSVEVAETGTDLVVYGGKVDLKIPNTGLNENSEAAKSKQFTTGQAVRVNLNGTLSRIMHVESVDYPLESGELSRPTVIASVTDNIVRDDYWTFYEIVPRGMDEDAQAFVDRFHEWNGVAESGMPSYLVGGDYVKMFNEDKMTEEYKIKVALFQPASLYVLLDTRVSPPKWLTDSFSDTGDQIGIDETHHHRPGKKDQTEVGPGNSIDRTHSIWKMVAPEGGTVVLGSNGKTPSYARWHNSMYGIVAVPLEQVEKSEF